MKHANISTLKQKNLALIFQCLRKKNTSRIDLSLETGLTKSAVTMITNQLIDDGIIEEVGVIQSKKGRNPILLSIVKNFRYALGIHLDRKNISIIITDLDYNILSSISKEYALFHDYNEALSFIVSSLQHMISEHNFDHIIGIGISSPGPVDYQNGVILTPPNYELFHNRHIVSDLKNHFSLPILLENNSSLLALTDFIKNPIHTNNNTLFVLMYHGIGSCIIKNGAIYHGFSGFSAELGHNSIDPNGPLCLCGNNGCLELYATLFVIQSKFEFSSYQQVVDDAYNGNLNSINIIKYIAEKLSFAFIHAINLFDLNEIILFGEYDYKPSLLISYLNELISKKCIIAKIHSIDIHFSKLSSDAHISSSVSLILNKYFDQEL